MPSPRKPGGPPKPIDPAGLQKEIAGLRRQLLFAHSTTEQSQWQKQRDLAAVKAAAYKKGHDDAAREALAKPPTGRKSNVLPPVRPSIALEIEYRKKIAGLVRAMHESVLARVKKAYKANPPVVATLAQDDLPSEDMSGEMHHLMVEWFARFEQGSRELAEYFALSTRRRTDAALKGILKRAGFAVEFELTAAQQDLVGAIIHENVALIRSIQQRYFSQVEQSVMRSVQVGRDIGGLTDDILEHYNVSQRRAELIARDQSNKATAFLNRGRQLELGINTAIWQHSHAGKTPRPTHVANDGKKFDVREGWFDPHEQRFIQPGELINCRCTARSIIPGFI